ncbi:MAG: DUF58 domain-containing protein [Planctomycetes bacterium]|nr:DUF58 domain-containing protein [Planctomycetota bacterium]
MSELFDAPFRELLRDVVRHVRELRAKEDEQAHARRRLLGPSGTFAGHRRYVAGDDLRRVDWNVFARSGELFVKQVEEEQRRAVTVLLDGSASMLAGDPPRFSGARRLVALLGAVALARLGGFRVFAGARLWAYARLGELQRLLRDLDGLTADATDQDAMLERCVRSGRLPGRIVWVSDFARLGEVARGLRRLAPWRRQLVGLLPRTADDAGPALEGRAELRDPETGARLALRIDPGLAAALRDELARLAARRAHEFAERRVPLVTLDLPAADDARASSWLAGGWLDKL